MPIVNAAGLRAATAVVAGLLLPALAAAADCRTPLRIAWPADRAPLSSSEQGQPRGLSAQYLKLLGAQRPLQMQPLPTAAIAEGTVPPDVQALLGWSRSQLPTGWVASAPTCSCHRSSCGAGMHRRCWAWRRCAEAPWPVPTRCRWSGR